MFKIFSQTDNKDFGTQVLISQSAYEEIQDLVETQKMHHARLKGKTGEYVLYDVKM